MNKKIIFIIIFLVVLLIGIIVFRKVNVFMNKRKDNDSSNNNIVNEVGKNIEMDDIKIKVNDEVLIMKLEENLATKELVEKLKLGDITVNSHNYGEFEQVGNLGFNLPTSDTQIKAKSGDVMLYQGNQITLFYGSNSWSYTRLGKITNKSESELENILGSGDVTLILSIK